MSNAAGEVTRIAVSPESAARLRALHVELSALSRVGPFLVYQDEAFTHHLESIMDDPEHRFTSVPGGDNFCHVRVIGDALFLNNIFVGDSHRGRGIGRALFRETLLMLAGDDRTVVELDAFVSNGAAMGWYRRLGFEEQSRTGWYDLGVPVHSTSHPRVRLAPDPNGFTQVLIGAERKGTLVGRRALLTDPTSFDMLGSSDVAHAIARSAIGDPLALRAPTEVSVRMRAPLTSVLERLSS